ncbi:DUF2889 domain-containing protein [Mycolicibacterium moriokaense]|nr:DUF2889 domain-containing protein [Mycolicibacterium moriokaense]
MPFVTDIAGPQLPTTIRPPLTVGTVRRTSTIDTHPAGDGADRTGGGQRADRTGGGQRADVELRARDAVGRGQGAAETLDEIDVRARLAERVIDDITPRDRLAPLLGSRVGPGFRATVGRLFPDDVARASLLHLLLDDWVGASLVSGYAVQHAAITMGVEENLPPGTADHMAGICAGFAEDASLVPYAKRNGTIPSVHGPVAPALDADGMHAVEPLRPHGMRRFRRLDLNPDGGFDAHFRDSHVDGDGVETIVHEYTVEGSVDASTRTIASISAQVRVLPWQECPGAIGSAARTTGMRLSQVRERVRGEFVGTSTCTHLNDTLRAIADLDALLDLRAGL